MRGSNGRVVKPVNNNNRGAANSGKIPNGINIRARVFLVSGNSFLQRRRAIENIKKRILKGRDTSLNTLIFYGKEADPKDLGERLFTVSFDREKIAVFKNFHNLSSAVSRFLFDNLKRILAGNYLIFETDKDYYQLQKDKRFSKDAFFTSVLKKAAVFRVSSTKKKATMDDFMASLRKNDLAASVYILESLFSGTSQDKILGPQIIGILTRKLSFLPAQGKKNSTEKEKYFQYLWQADRAIKEKGLDPRLVIESLLVKVLGAH